MRDVSATLDTSEKTNTIEQFNLRLSKREIVMLLCGQEVFCPAESGFPAMKIKPPRNP